MHVHFRGGQWKKSEQRKMFMQGHKIFVYFTFIFELLFERPFQCRQLLLIKCLWLGIKKGLDQEAPYSTCQFLTSQLISSIFLSNSMPCYLQQCYKIKKHRSPSAWLKLKFCTSWAEKNMLLMARATNNTSKYKWQTQKVTANNSTI